MSCLTACLCLNPQSRASTISHFPRNPAVRGFPSPKPERILGLFVHLGGSVHWFLFGALSSHVWGLC